MSERDLIQRQRDIIRMVHHIVHSQSATEAALKARWEEVQAAYAEARNMLAPFGGERWLQATQPSPPVQATSRDPVAAFQRSTEALLGTVYSIKEDLTQPPSTFEVIATWEARRKVFMGLNEVVTIAFSPDGCRLASGTADKAVKVWDVETGYLQITLSEHKNWVTSVAFSSDGRLLASGSGDMRVNVWEMETGQIQYTLSKHKDWVTSVTFSPDNRHLASGSRDKTVKVWDVESGRLLRTLLGHKDWVTSVAFSPDGRLLASGSKDKTVKVWDVESGRLLRTLLGHKDWVTSVAFSPDGRLLASGSKDKTVKVWEMETGRLRHTLSGHKDRVYSVAFSPDSRLLALGSGDKTVKIWDVESEQEVVMLGGFGEYVWCVAFSPDGSKLAVGGKTKIWILQASYTQLSTLAASLARSYREAQFWFESALHHVQTEHRRRLQDQGLVQAKAWHQTWQEHQSPSSTDWKGAVWASWTPSSDTADQWLLGGTVHQPLSEGNHLELPWLLPVPPQRSLLFRTDSRGNRKAVASIQSLLLRLLAAIPPGSLRFTFIDPIGLGQNVAPFMRLADYDEQLGTYRAWSEPAHIEQRLAELTEHMENVIQKYLRNEYATIEEYNAQAGEIAEPYRFLVVFGFPTNFSEDAARRLLSIAQNGPRCGVYAIVLADPTREMPHGFNLADLERACTVISWNGEHFVWEDEDFRHCALELDSPPEPDLFNRILDAVGEAAKEAGKVEVPFVRIAPPPEQWWTGDSRQGIRVPLGPAGARRFQDLELGKGTAQHALVVGRTGAGKSTLLHVLITNLALTYSPDEVELYLVDFKKGVEFKAYATYALPHARVVAIESEREFGLSVLQGLDAELKRRGDLFRAVGVDHIANYRNKTGERMPRILLIVDEFQEFFTDDDAVAAHASQILDRLVRQGRAFGVHVLLGSQTLAGSYSLARSTIDQMAVRIALQCSEADSRLILADDNPAARLLSRPGEAIYNDANGLVEGNHPFQVAWLPDDEREHYLERIRSFAEEQGYRPPQPQIVFEGNAPALIEHNQLLNDLLAAPGWPQVGRRVSAWLGEPVAIKPPTAAHFRRQSASNLLIVGRDDESAIGMVTAALLSLAAQHPISNLQSLISQFYILDFSPVDAPYADLLARLTNMLPHPVKRGRRRQLPDIIAEIAAEVDRRLEMDEDQVWKEPAVYLFIYGLQRARDLRQEEDFGFSFGMEAEEAPPNPAQQFATIVREGPEMGVHTIVWCDTYTNLTRTMDRRTLREFEMRVAMQMGAEDSANLIDTPAASKLGLYRAYFYSEDESRLEKFRPYGLPSEAWLEWVEKQWAHKMWSTSHDSNT